MAVGNTFLKISLVAVLLFGHFVFSKNPDSEDQYYIHTQEFIDYYESLEDMTFLELIEESTKHSIKIALVKAYGSIHSVYPIAFLVIGKIVDSSVNKLRASWFSSECEGYEEFRLFDDNIYELPGQVYHVFYDKHNSIDHKSYWKRQAVLEILDRKYGIVSLGRGEKYKIEEVN